MYTYPKYDLKGKVAVVTGAGQGLGKWIALALAEAGADVLVNALHSETAEKTCSEIRKMGRKSTSLAVDVSNVEAVKAMMATAEAEGRVLEFSGIEYMIRGRGYIKGLKDLAEIAVSADGRGTPVLLKDVADIRLGPEIRRGLAELDGQGEVAAGIVVVRFGENVLNVIERVKERIKKDIVPSLPKGGGDRHHL